MLVEKAKGVIIQRVHQKTRTRWQASKGRWRPWKGIAGRRLRKKGLFTFLQFPPLQWKALRTTNALERINEEFRRRTKTQASLPGEDAVLSLAVRAASQWSNCIAPHRRPE
jgi:transposase-like protein